MTDHDDTLRYLLALAGSIMEDASAVAILGSDTQLIRERISAVETVIADLAAVTRVMRVVERQRQAG